MERLTAHGRWEVQVERTGGAVAARLGARGALVLADGALFASDRVAGSFAVVDTGGRPGVPLFRDNRPVGRSDGRGKFVIVGLRAFEPVKISINPAALDGTVALERAELVVVPAERAGVPVSFGLRADRSVRVRLVEVDGAPVPAGSRATLNGGAALPVGFDGELFVAAPARGNRLVVARPDGSACEARFDLPAGEGAEAGAGAGRRLGAVRCVAVLVARR